jgi:hypothetical protein
MPISLTGQWMVHITKYMGAHMPNVTSAMPAARDYSTLKPLIHFSSDTARTVTAETHFMVFRSMLLLAMDLQFNRNA